jgi:hypothetical protein
MLSLTTTFCDLCEVAMDLHSGEDDCTAATVKADLIDRFWSFATTYGSNDDPHQ